MAWVGKRLLALIGACLYCSLQPALATDPPIQGEPVPNECLKAYPLISGQAPPEDLVDPGAWVVACNGVAVPTSLVGYYIGLDSWKAVAVAENEYLKSQVPSVWGVWKDRLSWVAVGVSVGVAAGVVIGVALEPNK